MSALIRTFTVAVILIAVVAAGPGALWLLGAEGSWLSWLPTDALVIGVQDPFWHQLARGLVNGIVLVIVTAISFAAWQKRSRAV